MSDDFTTTHNWQDLSLLGNCGSCKHYRPFVKGGQLTARGFCGIRKNKYKQRTEKCLKYEKELLK